MCDLSRAVEEVSGWSGVDGDDLSTHLHPPPPPLRSAFGQHERPHLHRWPVPPRGLLSLGLLAARSLPPRHVRQRDGGVELVGLRVLLAWILLPGLEPALPHGPVRVGVLLQRCVAAARERAAARPGRSGNRPRRARRLCHDAQPVVDAAGLLFAGRRLCRERVLARDVSGGLQAERLQPLHHWLSLSQPGHGNADAVHGRVRRGVGGGGGRCVPASGEVRRGVGGGREMMRGWGSCCGVERWRREWQSVFVEWKSDEVSSWWGGEWMAPRVAGRATSRFLHRVWRDISE